MQKKIGKRIHDARVRRNMTQEYLAEKADLSPSYISRLETGRHMVSIEKLYKIAQVLDVGLQDLLCDLFIYSNEDVQTQKEISYYISNMSTTERKHLLAYIELFKDFINKS